MATSALQSVIDNTISLIEAISPRVNEDRSWRYLPRSRAADGGTPGGRDRTFVVGDELVQRHPFVGAGLERVEYVLEVATSYDAANAVDTREADRLDLIVALEASSTYPSGAWGTCVVRWVEPVRTVEEIEGENRDVVVFEVHVVLEQTVANI